ncbi:Lsr2 dimerization domain-containing protein [Nocardia takedensis]|uniref:Lsr2 dimerization domain-containing protein n=1 Tax=Nocardia takedensis TaxID=259390 RepID=UPI003F76D568
MAKTTLIVTRDDWTGEIVDTADIAPKQVTTFTFNGREYSLDLSAASAEELAAALSPWMEKASTVNVVGRRTRTAKTIGEPPAETTTEDRAGIREWARDNGYDIGPRGRIAEAIVQAYNNRDDSSATEPDNEQPAPEQTAHPAQPDDAAETVAETNAKPTAGERAAIRQWALAQGIPVKARGPLSPELIHDYRQAHVA